MRLPREDRLKTIASLAHTVGVLAQALSVTPSVNVTGCSIIGAKGAGISIGFDDA